MSDGPELRVLSLGAGVQSTTLLLMALEGQIDGRLDGAIFADTGWEPQGVYDHLERLERLCDHGGIPLYRVQAGDLRADALDKGSRFASMPLFVEKPSGGRSMIRRQCTYQYKIRPIRAKIRELLGGGRPRAGAVEQWIGISMDEVGRMRDSDVQYIDHRWPLIEERLSRQDCYKWLESHGFGIPPKSSCVGCPFHDDNYWRQIKAASPAEFDDAVDFDEALRDGRIAFGREGLRGAAYLHDSLIPLKMVDLSTPEERGQGALFGDADGARECGGVCFT